MKKIVRKANSAKAALKPAKKSPITAFHLAVVVTASSSSLSLLLLSSPCQAQAKPVQLGVGPIIIVDLSACEVSVKECIFLEICKYLKLSLQDLNE